VPRSIKFNPLKSGGYFTKGRSNIKKLYHSPIEYPNVIFVVLRKTRLLIACLH
jgi:hypothetical protein